MGMSRGLRKLTERANTLQAWEDWEKLACQAVGLDFEEYQIDEPVPQAGWRTIDKHIAKLRLKIQRHQAQTKEAVPTQQQS